MGGGGGVTAVIADFLILVCAHRPPPLSLVLTCAALATPAFDCVRSSHIIFAVQISSSIVLNIIIYRHLSSSTAYRHIVLNIIINTSPPHRLLPSVYGPRTVWN